jgi:hypothetical protein
VCQQWRNLGDSMVRDLFRNVFGRFHESSGTYLNPAKP